MISVTVPTTGLVSVQLRYVTIVFEPEYGGADAGGNDREEEDPTVGPVNAEEPGP